MNTWPLGRLLYRTLNVTGRDMVPMTRIVGEAGFKQRMLKQWCSDKRNTEEHENFKAEATTYLIDFQLDLIFRSAWHHIAENTRAVTWWNALKQKIMLWGPSIPDNKKSFEKVGVTSRITFRPGSLLSQYFLDPSSSLPLQQALEVLLGGRPLRSCVSSI